MNNPLVQRAQYYLNESNRLTEELGTQIEYSRLLEAVLEEILTEEEILEVRKGILSRIGKTVKNAATMATMMGACTLGSGCGSKPVEPQKTSVVHAGAEGEIDPSQPARTKVVQKAKVDNRTDKEKYPRAGPVGEL